MKKTNVLILSATASAINYKNSLLDDKNISLHFTDSSKYAAGLYAEGIIPIIVPRSREQELYKKALDKIIDKYKIDVLIPTSDHDMEGVAKLLLNGWKPSVKMFDFDPHKLLLYTHKARLMERLSELGIEIPATYQNKKEFTYPLVIKPAREGGSKGVWIVKDEKDFEDKYAQVKTTFGNEIVFQQFIPGTTGSIHVVLLLYGNDGNIYGEIVSRSALTFMTWGGGGNAGEIIDNPALIDTAKDIIEKLGGWKGSINLEFKKNSENDKYYLMEINCRLNGYSYLTSMNGLNFPKAVVELLLYGKTSHLNYKVIKEHRNFITTFREMPVNEWMDNSADGL